MNCQCCTHTSFVAQVTAAVQEQQTDYSNAAPKGKSRFYSRAFCSSSVISPPMMMMTTPPERRYIGISQTYSKSNHMPILVSFKFQSTVVVVQTWSVGRCCIIIHRSYRYLRASLFIHIVLHLYLCPSSRQNQLPNLTCIRWSFNYVLLPFSLIFFPEQVFWTTSPPPPPPSSSSFCTTYVLA